MDSKEDKEIQDALREGRPETDEGPYYHDSWWESYKASIRGKLGGIIIGATIGALVGATSAVILPLVTSAALTIDFGLMVAGCAAAGMMYAMHEFSEVGKVTGAVSAAQEKAEKRMKAFEKGKFSKIEQEIGDIKSMLSGHAPQDTAKTAKSEGDSDYRSAHCDDEHCPPAQRKWVYWKIAAIGLIVGLGAGALLGYTGIAGHLLGAALGKALGATEGVKILAAAAYAVPMTILGLFGASFGINRDMFRQVFDKTDLWFKGIVTKAKSRGKQTTPEIALEASSEKPMGSPVSCDITTVVYDAPIPYPQSETYHRDKLLAAAKQALLSLDHTKTIPH